MASPEWYVARPGQQQVGPVSAQQLKQMAASGQVSGSDLVWKQGMPQWVPASQIKGLVSDSIAPMPRAPEPMPAPMAPAPMPADDFDGGGPAVDAYPSRGGDPWFYRTIERYAPIFMWLGLGLAGLGALGGLGMGAMMMSFSPLMGLIYILGALLVATFMALSALLGASTMRLLAEMGRTLRSIDRKTGGG
jgi:hypothetical protein